ncbi:uncharacterized protein LOC141691396 [Apium graveolens]|uniref:uncharacterized protein LOC141691396 n=1 Tax=Apium graveolens TaxID=4045 RepID=UPI003D79102C
MNRLPNATINFEVPYERLHGEKVDYENFKNFGCLAFAYNSNHDGDKFALRGVMSCFIGYLVGTKGLRILNLKTRKVFVSRHVKFFEEIFPLRKEDGRKEVIEMINAHKLYKCWEDIIEEPTDEHDEENQTGEKESEEEEADSQNEEQESNENERGEHVELRRSTRNLKQQIWLKDFVTSTSIRAMSSMIVSPKEVSENFKYFLEAIEKKTYPQSFHQAEKEDHWVKAMNEELNALEVNGT